MGPVPAREALEAMKRTDIQKLCKDYGVRANLKTEALINLLLDASRPQPPRPDTVQLPVRSTSRISSRSTVRRGSVIIHDINDRNGQQSASRSSQERNAKPIRLPSSQLPRRKARETQYRLGVGRPIVAGGKGARAVTKSVNVSQRSRRLKNSTTLQPSEATIVEEPEPEERIANTHSEKHSTGNSPPTDEPCQQTQPPLGTHMSGELVESAVSEALAPVRRELDSQKTQLAELKDKVSNMIVSFESRIRDLTLEIEGLRAQAQANNATTQTQDVSMADARSSPVRALQPPSTPKRVWSPPLSYLALPEKGTSSDLSSDSSGPGTIVRAGVQTSSNAQNPQPGTLLPGFMHSTLGKRVRGSTSYGDIDLLEGVTEPHLQTRLWRSATKRAKLPTPNEEERLTTPNPQMQSNAGSGYETEKGIDSILPMERLPEFYAGPSSPPVMSAPATSSATLINQNPFSFAFPVASTPAPTDYPMVMGTFPFPEPPTSPSPANTAERSHSESLGTMRGGSRVISGGSHSHGEPTGSVIQRAPSSNEVATRLGLTAIKTTATDSGTPAPPATRTMYGTEPELDTRFGDFGVDGVASGFWVPGR